MGAYESWGRNPKVSQQACVLDWRTDELPAGENTSLLPYGRGRSYGDCCLNDQGAIVVTQALDHCIELNEENASVRVEAGLTLAELLELIVPRGYFVPVTPGTRYVSVGGMVANDVHGKNHHSSGSFGQHVKQFELARSDGSRVICSPEENADLFAATIGGLGLTGLITWVEFALIRINSPLLATEVIKFGNLDEFEELTSQSDAGWEYTVAWVDSLASGSGLGRGHFMRGNHADEGGMHQAKALAQQSGIDIPLDAPAWLLNKHSIHLFNNLYYHRQRRRVHQKREPYTKFFYPLDRLSNWNRLYGKRGLYQFQCVLPEDDGLAGIAEILRVCQSRSHGSFLSVLKRFGEADSPGMLSFPRRGYTLALDFANMGSSTRELLTWLDDLVRERRGAIYPAKDATMSSESFKQYYPRWEEFSQHIDPRFSSSFWRRVTGARGAQDHG